jgi:hypothetical protein
MTEAAPLAPDEQEQLLWLLHHLERKRDATLRSREGSDRGLLDAAERPSGGQVLSR